MKVLTHDESIEVVKDFFDVDTYDRANHILSTLLQSGIASMLTDTGRISMPQLEPELREFFNSNIYKEVHQ